MNFKEFINKYCESTGKTTKDIQEELDIPQSTFSSYYTGRKPPNAIYEKFEVAYHVDLKTSLLQNEIVNLIPVYDVSIDFLDLLHLSDDIQPSYLINQCLNKNAELAITLKNDRMRPSLVESDLIFLKKNGDAPLVKNHKYYFVLETGEEYPGTATADENSYTITFSNKKYPPVTVNRKKVKAAYKITGYIREEDALNDLEARL